MLFEQWSSSSLLDLIVESVTGEIKDVQQDVKDLMDDLEKEGSDADEDEVKAAILLQALEQDGELEELDIDKAKKDIKEGLALRGKPLNESADGIIHIVEVAGSILGNVAFLEFITKKIEKFTGKAMDPGKVKSTIEKILKGIKNVTGLPGKAISKFFGWAAEKMGADINGKKAGELLGMGALVIFLFALGIIHFPVLGSGILWWVLSLTGLIGKSVELIHIYKEIKELIKKATEEDDRAEKELGLKSEDLEKMASGI